jgi:hypothetical protein
VKQRVEWDAEKERITSLFFALCISVTVSGVSNLASQPYVRFIILPLASLGAMQRMSDRQKTLAAHGVLMSDERLPMTQLDYRNLTCVKGPVLVHGEEEAGRAAAQGRNPISEPLVWS